MLLDNATKIIDLSFSLILLLRCGSTKFNENYGVILKPISEELKREMKIIDFSEDPYGLKKQLKKSWIGGWHGWFETNVRLKEYNMALMKLTAENIKNHYLILLIKLLILSLFIFEFARAAIETSIYSSFVAETGSGFQNYLNVLKVISFYRPAIILLIPLIGIFTNKKIGWILIQSYFYFLITHLVFKVKYIDLTNIKSILAYILVGLLFLLPIILMNKKKIRKQIYGINKTELISKNIIASVIAIAIILALMKTNGF